MERVLNLCLFSYFGGYVEKTCSPHVTPFQIHFQLLCLALGGLGNAEQKKVFMFILVSLSTDSMVALVFISSY
jgi:hypothetical protein